MEKEPIQVEPQSEPVLSSARNIRDSLKNISTVKIVIFAIFIIIIVALLLIGLGIVVYYLVKTDKTENSSSIYGGEEVEDVDSLLDKFDEELAAGEKELKNIRETEAKEFLSKAQIVVEQPSKIIEVENTEDGESSTDQVEEKTEEEKIVFETEIDYEEESNGEMGIDLN